ncbi:hypothetical protein DMUE_3936 [Dictyocoela muelleri]|nr:hypothetical protein DMUE_3936 [Dictyocoela muelleri]
MNIFYRITQICGEKGSGRTNFILHHIINKNTLYISSTPFPIKRYIAMVIEYLKTNDLNESNNQSSINKDDNQFKYKDSNFNYVNDHLNSDENLNSSITETNLQRQTNQSKIIFENLKIDKNNLWLYPEIINILNKLLIKHCYDPDTLYFFIEYQLNTANLEFLVIDCLETTNVPINKLRLISKNVNVIFITSCSTKDRILYNFNKYFFSKCESTVLKFDEPYNCDNLNNSNIHDNENNELLVNNCFNENYTFDPTHITDLGFSWEYNINTRIHLIKRKNYREAVISSAKGDFSIFFKIDNNSVVFDKINVI